MTDSTHSRADTTRQQILRAAAHQFAQRPYHDVGLDDILAEAELTKGAMYFHFRSKHALALAIIEQQTTAMTVTMQELLDRKLSGLETLVDFSYQMAVQDISQDAARAGMHLLETVGRTDGTQATVLTDLIQTFSVVVRRAITEGDIAPQWEPPNVGRLIVSVYVGMRHGGNLDEPKQFLLDLENIWYVVLNGIVDPDRIDYFRQFVRRRTSLAIGATST